MISLVLMVVAGALNAVMDKIAFNFKTSVFKNLNPLFWDVRQSWKNQWKQPLQPCTKYWWYFGLYRPKYQENFPYSTTMLVMFTDAWHLAKTLMLLCIGFAIGLHVPVVNWFVDGLIMVVVFTTVFTYFYDYILNSKK